MSDRSVGVHPIKLGAACSYLLVGEGGNAMLIDAGIARQVGRFSEQIARLGIAASRVKLLLITHCHSDHMGSAREIRDLCGAKVAVHAAEKDRLERGEMVMPGALTTWAHAFGQLVRVLQRIFPVPPCPVDIVVDDGGLDLTSFGIAGRVLHTPGHSPGSLSVVLEDGRAFVGDLAMNGLPLRLGAGSPIFAEQPERLVASWRAVLDAGATLIYPAHGPAFPAEVMRSAAAR